MTSGKPRTRRDQYRVWDRIYRGIRGTDAIAEQLGMDRHTVAECKADGCAILWALLKRESVAAAIEELCSRE